LLASYAYKERKNIDNRFKLGEGLVGMRTGKEKSCSHVPTDYVKITSGLGKPAAEHHRASHRLRRRGKAVIGTGQLDRFNPITKPSSISSPNRSASCSHD